MFDCALIICFRTFEEPVLSFSRASQYGAREVNSYTHVATPYPLEPVFGLVLS